ncbi:hypothetical protein QEN19_003608 [Hanseniaspora menglaensis]
MALFSIQHNISSITKISSLFKTSALKEKSAHKKIYSKAPVALPFFEIVKRLPYMFPLKIKQSFQDYRDFQQNPIQAQEDLIKEFMSFPKNSKVDFSIVKNPLSSLKVLNTSNISDSVNSIYFINELKVHNKNFALSQKSKIHVLLLHGYASAFGLFINNISKISNVLINEKNINVDFHCLDLPGYGFSSRNYEFPFQLGKHNYTDIETYFTNHIDTYISDLKNKNEIKHNDKIVIVSHSCGSYFTTLLASKPNLKHRIDKLVMVSPAGLIKMKNLSKAPYFFKVLWEKFNVSPFSLVRNFGVFGSMLTSGWSYKRLTFIKNKKKRNIFHKYIYSIFNQKGCGEYMLPFILNTGADPVAPLYERLFVETFGKKSSFSKETKWVWMFGDNDVFDIEGGEKCSAKLAEMGISSKVMEISNAGHHIYFDNHSKFNKILIEEIEQIYNELNFEPVK